MAAADIAVLVRTNAQLAPIEAELTRAGVAYQVRGQRFFDRPDVRGAIDLVRRAGLDARGSALAAAVRGLWVARLGYDEEPGDGRAGEEARERIAALDTLVDILERLVRADDATDASAYVDELERRRAAERAGSADGVDLLTYHRAKGLEWDAVALPALEDGLLPLRQAFDDDAALDEERRLLYVGITRARRYLTLSWAAERETRGRTTRRQPSRFLADLRPRSTSGAGERRVRELPGPAPRAIPVRAGTDEDPLMAALPCVADGSCPRRRRPAVRRRPRHDARRDRRGAAAQRIRPASGQGHRAGQGRRVRRRHPGHRREPRPIAGRHQPAVTSRRVPPATA